MTVIHHVTNYSETMYSLFSANNFFETSRMVIKKLLNANVQMKKEFVVIRDISVFL